MRFPPQELEYRIIAIAEKASGNADTGTAWLETKTFNSYDEVRTIIEWARHIGCNGRLILTAERKGD